MPKYYCDYCDVFLAVDSPSVRKMHNSGWKHKTNVRAYYAQFVPDAHSLMEQKTFMPPPQVGGQPIFPPGFAPPQGMRLPPGFMPPQGFLPPQGMPVPNMPPPPQLGMMPPTGISQTPGIRPPQRQ
jgi:U1 small nuclear ribonucleoprotein C